MATSDLGVVQVDLDRLDRLLNLVGELVITRSSFVDQGRRARARYGFKEQVIKLLESTEHIGRLSEEIQSRIIKARLVPVESLFGRFVGLVADLGRVTHKEIDLRLEGERTEVDKRTIDELAEPLVHLVRNAVDHGIEAPAAREAAGKSRAGTITLSAQQAGDRLVVEIRDDGAGVDLDAVRAKAVDSGLVTADEAAELEADAVLQLVFRSGMSTARRVTGLSGRGVGLDAALRRVEDLGGRLSMRSQAGEGTSACIELPLTTAIVEALMVGAGDERYALPLEHVREIVRARPLELATVDGQEVLDLRGEPLPLVRLGQLVGLEGRPSAPPVLSVVVVARGERRIGLVVDAVQERHEIVIKGLGRRFAGMGGIAGASIGGDGAVVMVLDVAALCAIDAAAPVLEG